MMTAMFSWAVRYIVAPLLNVMIVGVQYIEHRLRE